jgi:hypothetical protein
MFGKTIFNVMLCCLSIFVATNCKPTMICIGSKEQILQFDQELISKKPDSDSIKLVGFLPDSILNLFPDIHKAQLSKPPHNAPLSTAKIQEGKFELTTNVEGGYNFIIQDEMNNIIGYSEQIQVKKGEHWIFTAKSSDSIYYEMVSMKRRLFKKN